MLQVFRVTAAKSGWEAARDRMLGLGSIIQIITADQTELLRKTAAVLLPPILDPAFNCYPFYIPLLEASSFSSQTAGKVQSWLCGAPFYVRESTEDKGILIVSQGSLRPILQKLGGVYKADPHGFWRIPE